MRTTAVYAPPLVWGPWTVVYDAIGTQTLNVSYTQTGNVPTTVVGQIRYYSGDPASETTEDFRDTIQITNGNSVNTINVRLKGVPTGAQCLVTVEQ